MTVEIIRVDEREMGIYAKAMGLDESQVQGCVAGARGADPALVFVIGGQPVAACGFIPTAVLSGTVYAWGQTTPAMFKHKHAICKVWVEVIRAVNQQYPRIVGYCTAGDKSVRWWKRLGARFREVNGVPLFMIGSY